jgi:hypothetical protein
MLATIEKLVDRARAPVVKRTASDAAKLLKILKVRTFVLLNRSLKLTYLLTACQGYWGLSQGATGTSACDHRANSPLVRQHERRHAWHRCESEFEET